MPKNSLKKINIVIGIILLIVGLLFVSVNSITPHTVLIKVSHQVSIPNFQTLASMNNFVLNGYPPHNTTADIYQYFPAVHIPNGQTLKVTWYSDIFLGVFIFSQEQFANFQSILPNMQSTGTTPNAQAWANKNGITYEAVGWAAKSGKVSYNVTEAGNYVAVITNAMYGAAYASISDFNETLISYNYQTNYTNQKQNDNLYLYIGVIFMILGTAQLALTFFKQKPLKQHLFANFFSSLTVRNEKCHFRILNCVLLTLFLSK